MPKYSSQHKVGTGTYIQTELFARDFACVTVLFDMEGFHCASTMAVCGAVISKAFHPSHLHAPSFVHHAGNCRSSCS